MYACRTKRAAASGLRREASSSEQLFLAAGKVLLQSNRLTYSWRQAVSIKKPTAF